MADRIAIAVSGGIDSLVAAYLLRQAGCEVVGIHFFTGYEADPAPAEGGAKNESHFRLDSAARIAAETASRIEDQTGIPVETLDIRNEFQSCVVDYFTATYREGKTPNPCMVCNPVIKFGLLFEKAQRSGAVCLATGHYARIAQSGSGRYRLLKGIDPDKDQSYFLAFLSQHHLQRAQFPVGGLKKTDVRKMAAEIGLQSPLKAESQDVCFIKTDSYREFIRRQAGDACRPGPIVDANGKTIGRHEGLHRFTVGQRRGINCPARHPYYVLKLDYETNRLVVGAKPALKTSCFEVSGVNWIVPPPEVPIRAAVRIRYRHREAPCRIVPLKNRRAMVRFENAQSAVTPGQGAVFYKENEVLGAGWIERPEETSG